jgi:acyl carrier protein
LPCPVTIGGIGLVAIGNGIAFGNGHGAHMINAEGIGEADVQVHPWVVTTREQVETGLRGILAGRVGIPIDQLEGQARLVDDLEMDALDFVDVAFELERHFEISIPHDGLTKIGTVDEMVEFVLGLLAGKLRPVDRSLRWKGGDQA